MTIKSGDALEKAISWQLEEIASGYGLGITMAPNIGSKLKTMLMNLSEKKRVVILIDEHGYGLVNNINNKDTALEIHAILREFYSSLKGLDSYIQFLLITGVTKFSKTSLFSGLNNLNDISLDPRAAEILGYTREELTANFSGELDQLAQQEKISFDKAIERMQTWYNGYRFSKKAVYVFNPLSILYCLQKKNLLITGLRLALHLSLLSYSKNTVKNLKI